MFFARPENLSLLWSMPLLAAFLVLFQSRKRRRLERLVSPELAPRLTEEYSAFKAYARVLLLLGFWSFGILALARPQWGARLEEVRRKGVDVVVALDVSFSMNAEDVAPTRLQKAKGEIRGLISRLRGDRLGLVCFAGTAVLECPLTLDYAAVMMFLDAAGAQMVPEPGTSLAAAVTTANESFIARERKYKVLVVFTDGEDLVGRVPEAVRKARESGVVIYTVGIGTPEGRPLPVRDEKGTIVEYRKDSDGQAVVSRLDEHSLSEMAVATGGRYFRASAGEAELDQLYGEISDMEKKELDARYVQNLEDRYQYPLGLALVCLTAYASLAERRRTRRQKATANRVRGVS